MRYAGSVKGSLSQIFAFMSVGERFKYLALVLARSTAAALDLLGVLAIGLISANLATELTKHSSKASPFVFLNIKIPTLSPQLISVAIACVLAAFVLKALITALLTRGLARFVAEIEARASRKIVEKALGGDLIESHKVAKEHLYYVATSGVSAAFTETLNSIAILVSEGTLFTALVFAFFIVDPLGASLVIVYFSIIGWLVYFVVGRGLARATRNVTLGLIQSQTLMGDIYSAFRELTVSGQKNQFFTLIGATRLLVAQNIGKQYLFTALPKLILENAVLLGVLAFGTFELSRSNPSQALPILGIFFTGSLRIMAAMLPWQSALISLRQSRQQALDAAAMFSGMEVSETGDVADRAKHLIQDDPVTVTVSGLAYSYGEEDSHQIGPLDFEIGKGQQVAFIGSSGSGKTTLMNLLAGLIPAKSGSVFVDRDNVQDINRIRPGLISYVPQKPGVIFGSILQNITLSLETESIDLDALNFALEYSGFNEVVGELKYGLNAQISQERQVLSGGQLQRLGMARALYRKPGLLFLDESTSGLDALSEFAIAKTLAKLRGKVTTVLIAHRLNTVQYADRVFLMNKGQIEDFGTLSELIVRNPYVAKSVDAAQVNY